MKGLRQKCLLRPLHSEFSFLHRLRAWQDVDDFSLQIRTIFFFFVLQIILNYSLRVYKLFYYISIRVT